MKKFFTHYQNLSGNILKIGCTLILFFYISIAFGQGIPANLKEKRIEYLSKTFSIGIDDARQLFTIMEDCNKNLNKIYNDSLLSEKVKIEKMEIITDERDNKIKQLIPDKTKSDRLIINRKNRS